MSPARPATRNKAAKPQDSHHLRRLGRSGSSLFIPSPKSPVSPSLSVDTSELEPTFGPPLLLAMTSDAPLPPPPPPYPFPDPRLGAQFHPLGIDVAPAPWNEPHKDMNLLLLSGKNRIFFTTKNIFKATSLATHSILCNALRSTEGDLHAQRAAARRPISRIPRPSNDDVEHRDRRLPPMVLLLPGDDYLRIEVDNVSLSYILALAEDPQRDHFPDLEPVGNNNLITILKDADKLHFRPAIQFLLRRVAAVPPSHCLSVYLLCREVAWSDGCKAAMQALLAHGIPHPRVSTGSAHEVHGWFMHDALRHLRHVQTSVNFCIARSLGSNSISAPWVSRSKHLAMSIFRGCPHRRDPAPLMKFVLATSAIIEGPEWLADVLLRVNRKLFKSPTPRTIDRAFHDAQQAALAHCSECFPIAEEELRSCFLDMKAHVARVCDSVTFKFEGHTEGAIKWKVAK